VVSVEVLTYDRLFTDKQIKDRMARLGKNGGGALGRKKSEIKESVRGSGRKPERTDFNRFLAFQLGSKQTQGKEKKRKNQNQGTSKIFRGTTTKEKERLEWGKGGSEKTLRNKGPKEVFHRSRNHQKGKLYGENSNHTKRTFNLRGRGPKQTKYDMKMREERQQKRKEHRVLGQKNKPQQEDFSQNRSQTEKRKKRGKKKGHKVAQGGEM